MSLSYPEPVRVTACSSTVPRLCFGCGQYHIGLGDPYWWHHDSGKLVHDECYDDQVREQLLALSDIVQTTSPPADPITVADELLPAEEPALRVVCAWCKTTLREGVEPASHGICDSCKRSLSRLTVDVDGHERSLEDALEDERWAEEWERFVSDDDDTPPAGLPRPALD